jgi:cytochrome c oxidase assembly protein subunit 11
MAEQTTETTRKTKRLVIKLALFTLFMFGFCYALVPLYNVLCKATGLNGKVDLVEAVDDPSMQVDETREVTVQFVTTTNEKLPWQFRPNTQQIKVHPGKKYKVSFFAENDSDKAMTVQAIPSVTPGYAVKYLKKTQCFCFTQQKLAAHTSADMPMIFHLDPHLPKEYNTITISYTLFDAGTVTPKQKVHQNVGHIVG